MLLDGRLETGQHVVVDVRDGHLEFRVDTSRDQLAEAH
jgi:hypothetical protein